MAESSEGGAVVVLLSRRPRSSETVVNRIRERGLQVVIAYSEHGIDARDRLDCAIVDVSDRDEGLRRALPGILQRTAPFVLVITDATDSATRIEALRLGVGDHCVAPCDPDEVVARVEMLLYRRQRLQRGRVEIGDIVLRPDERRAFRSGYELGLTPLEFDILAVLAEADGSSVSKIELLRKVWDNEDRNVNAVEAHISALRRKLDSVGPPVIHTVHRRGYSLRPARPSHDAGSREGLLADRARLVRERDEAIRQRDELLKQLRGTTPHFDSNA